MSEAGDVKRTRLSTATPLYPTPGSVYAVGVDGSSGKRRGGVPPGTSCLLATLPRSGSWLLADLLWRTRRVGEPHEYFRSDFTALWGAEWGLPEQVSYRDYVHTALSATQTVNGIFCAKV